MSHQGCCWEAERRRAHGQKAARSALRILNGESPASIPIQDDEAEHVLANAVEFDRRGLDLGSLPSTILVVNRAPSFVREHFGLVVGTVAFIAVQTLAIAALVVSVRSRRRAEARLESQARLLAMSNANLEGANRQLLAEQEERQKAEERLLHAQKMEAIGRLAGGVAHDFNNLLTVILGYSDLLLADSSRHDPRASDVDGDSQGRRSRGAALTRQLLAFSRKQVLEPTSLDLNAVVADMREDAAAADRRRRRRSRPSCRRRCRRSWLTRPVEQVIVNLAVNARDAMPGGGMLTIETAQHRARRDSRTTRAAALPPGRYVLLAVTDTGAGMEPQVLAQIFEPFFTTKDRGKGTGLGLAMVYGIVKQSGGWIWGREQSGHGRDVPDVSACHAVTGETGSSRAARGADHIGGRDDHARRGSTRSAATGGTRPSRTRL